MYTSYNYFVDTPAPTTLEFDVLNEWIACSDLKCNYLGCYWFGLIFVHTYDELTDTNTNNNNNNNKLCRFGGYFEGDNDATNRIFCKEISNYL